MSNEHETAYSADPDVGSELGTVEYPQVKSAASKTDFLDMFNRHFDRVYSYVNRRVQHEPVCERVVREVLVTHLHLLVYGEDEKQVAYELKVASDRLIRDEVARALAVRDGD